MKFFLYTLLFFLLVTQICFAQWYKQNPFTNLNLNNACYSIGGDIFVVGEFGSLYFSSDNRNTWQSCYIPNTGKLNSLSIIDDTFGFVVGESGNIFKINFSNMLLEDISIAESFQLKDVVFNNIENGIVVGTKQVIIDGRIFFLPSIHITTNGGEVWNEKQFDIRGKLNSVSQIDEKIIAVGDSGLVLISDIEGNHWEILNLNTNANLQAVRYCPTGIGIIVGDNGTIFISEDDWQSWDIAEVPEYYNLKSVCAKNTNEFEAAGYMRVRIDGRDFNVATIFSSIDGGINWDESFISDRGTYNSISFCNPDLAIAVGDSGLVTMFESLTSISDNFSLTNFNLEQNYPNPFNPSTAIKYQISNAGLVQLKVYNVLGREVTTLVNEEQPAGNFEVEFSTSTIKDQPSSGVYFYQLKAGDFIQTRKMILLK